MPAIKQPRYRTIALRIAELISNGQLQVGTKIHARSTLATSYGVSSETARRAISILEDLGIVETRHGSGAIIISRDKAQEFINSESDAQNLQNLQTDLSKQIEDQKAGLMTLTQSLNAFIEQTQYYKKHNPFRPYELQLVNDSPMFDQTVSELNFWHRTGTTLVGILHENRLTLSPGPYAKIQRNDTLYFVGDELSVQNVYNLFYE